MQSLRIAILSVLFSWDIDPPFHARIATTSPEKAGFSSTEPRAYCKIWPKDGPRSSRIAVFRSRLGGLNVGHPIYFCVFVPSALDCKRTRVNEPRRTYPGS